MEGFKKYLQNLNEATLKDLLKQYKWEHTNGLDNHSLKISAIYKELESRENRK